MIEWKGLYANTPYSSANNKTQDDAVVGMQDTIYVTGPGYGGYEANVRVHNASGTVVASIPVSGGGGALSAPAPVRILDDSTTYSYSLEVVRGVVPADDPDKIVIRIIGGASKRYPGQVSTLPDGSTSFPGPLRVAGGVVAPGASMFSIAPISQFAPHPCRPEDAVSSTTNATCQINILAPVAEFTHIAVEIENKAASEYSGILNVIAAVSNSITNMHPTVGKDVTGNPRTGWVSVATSVTIPARPGAVEEGSGYWLSSKIFLPSHYATPPTNRTPVVCLRYWLRDAGSTYRWLQNSGSASAPPSDAMGNYCVAKRITSRTTNADCVAGTAEAGGDLLNAGTDGVITQIARVYFYNGNRLVGVARQIGVEICGASTMSQQGAVSAGGLPWVGRSNAVLRQLGITLGYSARGGSTTAQYLAAAKARLNSCQNHYCVYPVFAGNDASPYTEASSLLQVQRFFEFADYARSKNVVPIGVIMPHDGVGTGDEYTYRENSVQIVLSSGLACIDARAWLGQAALPNLFAPENTLDGTHLSAAGEDAMVANFPGALQAITIANPPMR